MYPIHHTTDPYHSYYIDQQQPHVTSISSNDAGGQPIAYSGPSDISNGIVTIKLPNPSQYQMLLPPQTVQQRDTHFYHPIDLTTKTIDANRARIKEGVRLSAVHSKYLPTPH